MTENLVDKACRYFREGRILVEERTRDGYAVVVVRGRLGVYRVVHADGRWRCTCPALVDRCAHVIGAALACDPDGIRLADELAASDVGREAQARSRQGRATDLRVRDVRTGDAFRFASSPVVRTLAERDDVGDDEYLLTFTEGTRLHVRGGQRVILADRAPSNDLR